MGRGYFFLVLAGCGFHSAASAPEPSGNAPDAPAILDAAPPGSDSSVADTRVLGPAEFAAGQLVNMTLDRVRGSLTPNAYTYGGLIVRGAADVKLWTTGETAWSRATNVVATGAGLWRGESIAASDPLDNVGVPATAKMLTIWLEGEVWLTSGASELFSLTTGDFAFFQIAQPGGAVYGPAIEAKSTPVAVATPVTGWYPIRIGFAYGTSSDHTLAFQHSDGGGAPVAWTRDRLRARASEMAGPLRTVFFRQMLGGGAGTQPPVSHVDDSAPAMTTKFPSALPGAPASNVRWSARYAAQLYAAQAGAYTITVASDDGNHIALGAMSTAKSWQFGGGLVNDPSSVTATLPAGWADLVVDYNQVDGDHTLKVTITGPGVSGGISPDQLRPVEPAADRLVYGNDETSHTIADNGGSTSPGTATLSVAAYGDAAPELVTAIDVTYQIDSPRWGDLKFDLETPSATRVTLPTARSPLSGNDQIGQASIVANTAGTSALLGVPASGVWKLHVYDTGPGGGASTLKSAKLTLHTQGGPDKIARTASWLSAPIDAGTSVFTIDGVTANVRLPDGATVQVGAASCHKPDCSDAVWSAGDALIGPVAVAPARYLQLRADLTSNGSLEPELMSLAVALHRAL